MASFGYNCKQTVKEWLNHLEIGKDIAKNLLLNEGISEELEILSYTKN
jgi:hypothetical protein